MRSSHSTPRGPVIQPTPRSTTHAPVGETTLHPLGKAVPAEGDLGGARLVCHRVGVVVEIGAELLGFEKGKPGRKVGEEGRGGVVVKVVLVVAGVAPVHVLKEGGCTATL